MRGNYGTQSNRPGRNIHVLKIVVDESHPARRYEVQGILSCKRAEVIKSQTPAILPEKGLFCIIT
ncbi:MAG: hypothetical protein AYP45_03995 [Candidatus Brocadia carolinensis]|uniref:Uncharacterized protein n=1 Tax=Candidatus Brocadia carolinensis TaxID=1004156 RepID=A0A1V4AW41_9BACT|nr:MAG: hypothetical protein AYP45_03995 [Candidatus Brocadia caroliniensis]